MDGETIALISKLVTGDFDVAVKDKNQVQKYAYMKWYRNRDKCSVVNGQLLWMGKRILEKNKACDVVLHEFQKTKGSGARKLLYRLRSCYVGLSERNIQKLLNENTVYQRLHCKFCNKPQICPF